MADKARRWWQYAAAGAIVVATVVGLYLVGRSRHSGELEGFAGLALSVAAVAAAWIKWVWQPRSSEASEVASGQELERLSGLLAAAVEVQWTRAAGERELLEPAPIPVRWHRSAMPFTGPLTAAVASKQFAPLPGLTATKEWRLRAGQVDDLHKVYGGLGSGRLVIAGGPGSGKSGAAVLLILAALQYRRSIPDGDRPQVPVPVMFTLQGWDPNIQSAREWLAERLSQTYPLFTGRQGVKIARGMLDQRRIAVIFDGLDEVPEELRPAMLRVLSQQATFRLVLLTRSAEMTAAAAQGHLQGAAAIELQDIDPTTAADYLTRTQLDPPPQAWSELVSRLRREPGSPLAQALNNPLMLTLVRDTYGARDDVGELLDLRDADGRPALAEDIGDYLLDRVLPAAYTQQPGEPPPRYDLPTAERALRCIATRMNNNGTRDLQWWLVPAWAPARPRVITTWLGTGLAGGLTAGLVALVGGLHGGTGLLAAGAGALAATVAGAIIVGLLAGLAFGRGKKIPKRRARMRWRQLFRRRALVSGLAVIVVGYALFSLPGRRFFDPLQINVKALWNSNSISYWAWLVAFLMAWLGSALLTGMSRSGTDNASPLSPLASWRSDQGFALMTSLIWVVGSVALGLVAWLLTAELLGPAAVLAIGLAAGLVTGLVYPQTWSSSLAFAQLARSDQTPIHLMRFLEDARSRNVLRTVGPVYQFRHARLQDRLAAQKSATGRVPTNPASGR
jgi:hypothetical protein